MAGYGSDISEKVYQDLKIQEDYINATKFDKTLTEDQQQEYINQSRQYQLDMLKSYKENSIKLYKRLNDLMINVMNEQPLSDTNRSILEILYNFPKKGGRKSRRRKSKSKRTRRMRR